METNNMQEQESIVGTWVETSDGKIVEVESETDESVLGIEIVYNVAKPLRYGKRLSVNKSEVVYA